jgi:lipopolysaccharide/colanic/teichoic acid biosynthesis glycosyltransferase
MFIAWAVATVETKSNGFFIQRRIGLNGKAFSILKIKTMKKIDGIDTTITSSNDIRITKSGKLFRNTKIDELPQLLNVFVGDMSFVGPRPDVAGYADKLLGDDRIILSIRPGITGPASLKYKNEEEILANQSNPKIYNDTVIWPDKVNINKEYIQNWSFKLDLHYLIRTIR